MLSRERQIIESWFTQTQWQDIKFTDLGVPLNSKEPASAAFYSSFCRELQTRYPTYDSLPADWRKGKQETAQELARLIPRDARVLSCGAGIGFVEHVLVHDHGFSNLTLWDWAPTANFYSTGANFNFLDDLVKHPETYGEEPYDFVFLSQVLYGMSATEAVDFLTQIGYLMQSGELILANTSPVDTKNGTTCHSGNKSLTGKESQTARIFRIAKGIVRPVLGSLHIQGSEQGWGWARDNEAVSMILQNAGYRNIRFHAASNQSFAIATPY